MARIKIDTYADPSDASAALGALREVGLNPGDVGSAWKASVSDAAVAVHEVSVEGLGPLHFTGWLAESALKAAETASAVDLAQALKAAGLEEKDIARARDALTSGGGVIGVRARDSLSA
jgi:hypothetical protein